MTTAETFNLTVPLTVVLMSILGGTRHWAGPAIGAVAITCLLFAFTGGSYAVLGKGAIGLILVIGILFMPAGAMGRRRRKRAVTAQPAPAPQLALVDPAAEGGAPGPAVPATEGAAARGQEVLLEVRALGKSFRGVTALRDVTLQVRKGEILGLLGPNGSGKSTFINVVSGHYLPDAGAVWLGGRNIAGLPGHAIARAGITRP